MTIPTSVIKFGFEKAGAFLGGPIGAAVAGLAATSAFATAEISSLAEKLADGTATSQDIVSAMVGIEGALLASGGLSAAAGMVAAPGTLITTAVIVGAVGAMYFKNPTASMDAFMELVNDWGQQPWTLIGNAAGAYSREIGRQNAIDAQISADYRAAKNFERPKDPLALDLNGNGIEATVIDNSHPRVF